MTQTKQNSESKRPARIGRKKAEQLTERLQYIACEQLRIAGGILALGAALYSIADDQDAYRKKRSIGQFADGLWRDLGKLEVEASSIAAELGGKPPVASTGDAELDAMLRGLGE